MRPGSKLALIGVGQRLSDRLPERWGRRARDLGKIALNYRGQRKHAFRHVQYELVRRASPVLAAPFGAGQLLVDAQDDEIGRTVFVSGGYERWHMEAAVSHLRAAGQDPTGKVFVDIGANIGTSTVDALAQFGFGRAVCFEPAPENVRLLRVNLVWNELDTRAAVHAVAVSDHDGRGELRLSDTNAGDHRFAAGSAGSDECRRLDFFVDTGVLDPGAIGLVWIDTQGHEPHVLRGASQILAAGVPIVLEYCPWILGDGIGELDALIGRHFGTILNLNTAAERPGDTAAWLSADDLPALGRQFARRGYADLLLLP